MKKLLLVLLLSTGLYASQENPDDIFERNFNPEFLNGDLADLDENFLPEESLEDNSLTNQLLNTSEESLPFNHQDSLSIHMQNHSDDTMHKDDTHLINDKTNPINIHKPTLPKKDLNLIRSYTMKSSEDESENEYFKDGSDFNNKRKKPNTNHTSIATPIQTISSLSASQSTTNSTNHTTAGLSSKTNTTQRNIKEKPHQCIQCDKHFRDKSSLTIHMRTHTGEKPHQCTQCDRRFSDKRNLNQHIKATHTGDRPYQCTECDKHFSKKQNLTKHMRTHTGEKPHQCTQCDKRFCNKTDLITHTQTIHTNEKSYQCTHEGCNYSTADQSNFIRHARKHTGEKSYQCTHEGCDYSTAYKNDLTRHIRIHKDEESDDSEHEEEPS